MEKRLFKDCRSFRIPASFLGLVFLLSFFFAGSLPCGAAEKSADQESPESDTALAIKGYDPVAYFREGRPVKGKSAFAYEQKGQRWLFVSEDNKLKFVEYPEKYLPEYDGYSALEIGEGRKIQADPKVWSVIDGKLYLHKNTNSQSDWEKQQKENRERADYQWPRIR